MNRLLLFLAGVILALIAQMMVWPWYLAALLLLPLAIALPMRKWDGFWLAFWAGFFIWGGLAAYYHIDNGGLLGDRMAGTFGLPSGWLLVAITALWGGLTLGLAGWTGVSLRAAISPMSKQQ